MSKTEELFSEIHNNIKNDRRRLEDFCDAIKKVEVAEQDPMAKIALTDNLTQLVDSLTRSNAQLVELLKVKVKKELVTISHTSDGLLSKDANDVFNEIGDGFSESDEEVIGHS